MPMRTYHITTLLTTRIPRDTATVQRSSVLFTDASKKAAIQDFHRDHSGEGYRRLPLSHQSTSQLPVSFLLRRVKLIMLDYLVSREDESSTTEVVTGERGKSVADKPLK